MLSASASSSPSRLSRHEQYDHPALGPGTPTGRAARSARGGQEQSECAEQWGARLAGDLRAMPSPSRRDWLGSGEFTEVAHRMGGTAAAVSLAETPGRLPIRPGVGRHLLQAGRGHFGQSSSARPGTRSSTQAPSLGVYLSPTEIRRRLAGHRRLRRSEVALMLAACPRKLGAASARVADDGEVLLRRAQRGRRGWDASESPTLSGTRRGPSARVSGNGCACTPTSLSAYWASEALAPLGTLHGGSPQASATLAASRPRRSHCRLGCSVLPTPTPAMREPRPRPMPSSRAGSSGGFAGRGQGGPDGRCGRSRAGRRPTIA